MLSIQLAYSDSNQQRAQVMWDAIRYEFSMMGWKNFYQGILPVLLMFGLWIYVPRHRARYRQYRKRFEQTLDSTVQGQVLYIQKLHLPPGEDGLIRFLGHNIHFTMIIDEQVYHKEQFVPSTVDPEINQQLFRWRNGDTKALVRYNSCDPSINTLQLINFVF